MGILHQTYFLLRKNFQVKKRHKKLTIQEIIIPIYWVLILLIIKLTSRVEVKSAIGSNEIPRFHLRLHVKSNNTYKPVIGVVTNGEKLCTDVFQVLKKVTATRNNYIEFNSTDQLLEYYKKGEKTGLRLGIVFEKDQHGLSYTMHFAEGMIPDLKSKTVTRDKCHDMKNLQNVNSYNCPASMYIINEIALLQSVIDSSISKVLADLPYYVMPNITVQMMPKREFTPDLSGLSTTVPIYMVLAFAPYIMILLINLVGEKEKKHKELLRIMGMYDTAYWLSWFLTYAILLFLASMIVNAIAVPSGILGNSNFVLMVIVFYLFGLSLIMFAFMLTPLFKKAMNAGLVANLTTVLFAVLIIPLRLPNVPNIGKWLASLLSPTAFAFVLTEAVDSTGLHFDNLFTKGDFPPGNALMMIVVDIFLYLLLALYLDSVMPAEYGKRRPPYFIFMPSYWRSIFCGENSQPNEHELSRQLSVRGIENMEDVEPVGQEMIGKEAISIHKLRKVFHGKEDVVAVDDFSMDIYEGQVTALLGHNGAGKSTLIAALTGMITPTSGTALFYGKDITDFEQMTQIRKSMGVCPQQDVLFDYVTVQEHLELYSGLKGIQSAQRKTMVSSIIKDIGLEDKADEIAKNLSGGQKRKLSVGIALCGNPKVLFLDEPTSGMDPYSRRSMWSLLQKQSKNKVVLLTTHFMDEADILADYKAIMSSGKLRCAGSSLFLKNRFGIGYHLNMSLSNNCDSDALVSLVKRRVEGADVIRHHGYELAFSLPIEQVENFSGLFAALEEHNDGEQGCAANQLGVSSYGVSMTTLEEVFLQLEETTEKDLKGEEEHNQPQTGTLSGSLENLVVDQNDKSRSQASNLHHTGVELDVQDIKTDTGTRRSFRQLRGLLVISWLMTIRSPLKIIFMIIIPPILLIVGLILMATNSSTDKYELTRVQIAPDLYLTSASSAKYATPLLFQNSTGKTIDDVLGFLKDYKVDVEQVKSLNDYMNISRKEKPYRGLGLQAVTFPNAKNMSAKPNLGSNFLLRFNDTMVHSIPVGVNLISSLFNMYALQAQNKTPRPIKTFFQPFPNLKPKWKYDSNGFVSILLIGLSFVIFPGSFALMVIAQRQMGAYHLLRVSSVPTVIYWFYLFISDALVFLIPSVIMLILIPAIGVTSLASSAAMGCLVLSVLLYIPSSLLFTYCFSFMFDKWETAQNIIGTVYTYFGLIPFVVVSLVDMLGNAPDTAMIIHYIFVFLDPPYSIIGALYYINRVHMFATLTAQSSDVTIPASEYFTWSKHNGIPAAFIAMALQSVVFFCLLYYLDTRKTGGRTAVFPCKIKSSSRRATSPSSFRDGQPTDDDVKAEKEKLALQDINDPSIGSYSVAVKNLWKRFGKGKKQKVVVKDLYFGVQRGEVFGLLGPNGAGKTTTLNMITAAVPSSRGQVSVCGFNVNTDSHEVFQRVGYCPQVDAQWPEVTLKEHLVLYARVRGIPEKDIKRTVDYFLSSMKLTEHANKRAKDLSGGTKRKLSFQMAMLGGPELLLLDEPSTGLDPSARRFLWNTISKNVCGDRGAILTTHSMEEADALSSRVGIMVKGELKCIGSTQHLKNKYGSGYSLEIKVTQRGNDAQSKLDDFVKQLFPTAILNETFGGKSTYKVPKENVALLSSVFAKLEEGKQIVGIEEYSFSQSTLEQVFLEFAREQDDDRTGDKDPVEDLPPENGPQMA